jgi:hypothetical protein
VPFSGGKPSGPAQDVVTGFLDANNHARGRPVGLAVDRTGALLIADDVGDTVWRLSSSNPILRRTIDVANASNGIVSYSWTLNGRAASARRSRCGSHT